MKRMMHPLHGFHHAYNTVEEAYLRERGWIAEDEAGKAPAPEATPESVKVDVRKTRYAKAK